MQSTVEITCRGCGTAGTIVWDVVGKNRALVSLSNSFYERLSRKKPYPIEVVCHQCGTPQPERP